MLSRSSSCIPLLISKHEPLSFWAFVKQIFMSPTEGGREGGGRGVHIQRDSFFSARYIINRLEDFKHICMDITLGYVEELIMSWQLGQGHYGT